MMRPVPANTVRLPRAEGRVQPDDFNSAMQLIEQMNNGTLKQGSTPTMPAVILLAADGSAWRLSVQPDGSLTTSAVPR